QVLVDTGVDCKNQLVGEDVQHLDGVVYTHPHADHLHGLDDLRPLAIRHRKRVDVYMDADTSRRAHEAFGYCFVTPEGSNYPPILEEHRIEDGRPFSVPGAGGALPFIPFSVDHGDIRALGLRIGDLVYLPDVKRVEESALDAMRGARILIVDALRDREHVSHFNVRDALALIDAVKPERAALTNLHIDLDYAELLGRCPPGVEPAYDGMVFEGF
ncbi:MAG: MBL fold metallo-hydrolase, partial [Hyphomicrobiaceae bacterium]|nr:MBL fold metallo-hydrolase [Hyphomicrobiaceae bacterium]